MGKTTTTKNTLPSFAHGKYENILKLVADEKINAPAFVYFTDRECLGFLDTKKVLHTILWDKIVSIENQLEGLNDPDTGEPIPIKKYVQPTIEAVHEIQKNGATIMITSTDTDNGGDA